MAANLAIEEVYRMENGDHGVLFGSQFEEGFAAAGIQREIRLPERAPNKEFGNYLLEQLRGPRGGPRKPDIVDFNDRAFYEIKPVRTFEMDRQKTIHQHVGLYRMAESIVHEFNDQKRSHTAMGSKTLAIEDPWNIENSKWKPPSCLSMPGLNGWYKLDTFKTDYQTDRNCRGIIVYRVWKKVRRREEEANLAVKVVVDEKDKRYDKLLPAPATLPKMIGRYSLDEPDHLIIIPKHIHDLLGNRTFMEVAQDHTGQFSTREHPSLFSKAGSYAPKHPYLTAGAVIAVAATGVGLYVWGAAEAGAAGAGGVALSEQGGAKIISLAARQLAAKGAAEVAKKAAAVLIFFGVVKNVRADDVSFSHIETMKAIPLSCVAPYKSTYSALGSGMCIADAPEDFGSFEKDICVGDQVMFDSAPHAVVATLTAYPNNLSSGQ
jgi:hypothetical protein